MEMTYGSCALQLPRNYVVVDADEMEYVEGGVQYTSAQSKQIALGFGFVSGQALMAAAATAAVVSKVLQWAKSVGGPLVWLVGLAAGVITGALGKVAYGIGYSAVSGKTVVINASPAPWDCFVDVYWK